MNIFVGNLNYGLTSEDIQEIFEEYGEVSSVKVITDKLTGKSKGFGFVEMSNDDEAKRAIEDLNGAEVEGRTIVVNESIEKPRDNNRRPGGDRNFRGPRDNNRRDNSFKPRY